MSDYESDNYESESIDGDMDETTIINYNHNEEDSRVFFEEYNKNIKNNKTTPILTKYERTNILSERSQQIMDGATPLISNPETYKNSYDIAVQELIEKKIPFIIKRPYNNSFEYWKLEDLL